MLISVMLIITSSFPIRHADGRVGELISMPIRLASRQRNGAVSLGVRFVCPVSSTPSRW
jgi:hypothetical protein